MKFRFALAVTIVTASPTLAQQLVDAGNGTFYCHGDHPRCSYPDQSTYPYYQFGGQHVGQLSGISDVLPPGPPLIQYQTNLFELISERANTNAVASWSDATSAVDGGRVWGGFISARTGFTGANASTSDSQLIGLEIDVLNGGLPGTYPNDSKVGLQIVGFGNANTNAIEILTQTPSAAFQNGIDIQANSIAPNGAIIGVSPQNVARGIDFQGSNFSDAAMVVSANQRISFRTPGTTDAAIWRDSINNGYLVLQAGPPGLRIVNSANNQNLMIITPDGNFTTPLGSFSNVLGRLNTIEADLGIATRTDVVLPVGADLATETTGHQLSTSVVSANASSVPAAATGANSTAAGDEAVASGASSTALGSNAKSSGANSVALGANSTDDGRTNVISVGDANQTRTITNVTAGVSSTDAVNVGQLNNAVSGAITSSEAYTDSRINQVNFDVGQVRRDANGAAASAMAIAGIPQTFERGRGMIGMGVATWQGQSAIAFGMSKATDNGRLVFKASAAYNTRSQGGGNAGVGYAF